MLHALRRQYPQQADPPLRSRRSPEIHLWNGIAEYGGQELAVLPHADVHLRVLRGERRGDVVLEVSRIAEQGGTCEGGLEQGLVYKVAGELVRAVLRCSGLHPA